MDGTANPTGSKTE